MSNESKSCWGCKFLYGDGSGFSNFTWMETAARCALYRNPNLIKDHEVPYEPNPEKMSLWAPIKDTRCDGYSPGPFIVLDPDRDGVPHKFPTRWEPYEFADEEQYLAMATADGWPQPLLPLEGYMKGKREHGK